MTEVDPQLMNDEEYARQLQQEEFGSLIPGGSYFGIGRSNNNNISAPLLNDSSAANQNNEEQSNPLLNNDPNNNQPRNRVPHNNVNGPNAGQRARRNVIGSVREADTDSPRILLLRVTMALIEVIATATVLAIGWNQTGESDCTMLKWWVLMYTARHFITTPLRIHIFRAHRRAQNNLLNQENVQQSTEKAIQSLRWLSIVTFLWFLVGQTFLFTAKQCASSSPTIWYYCLVIIVLVYVSLALPFLIVLAICICLPCVLIVFRFFAEPEGADDRIIKDLPTRKITADDLRVTTATVGTDESGKDEKADDRIDEEEAPSCAICMQEYKIDEEIRTLPCKHEFHCECVDKWLPMKKICPLCRHDITKKAPANQSSNNLTGNPQNDNNNASGDHLV
jgi:hypothetical protein